MTEAPARFFDPLPQAHFRAICVDYPWKFSAGTKVRPQHYQRMTDAEIVASIPDLVSLAHPEGCWFFIWVTWPLLERFFVHIAPALKRQRVRFSSTGFTWGKLHKSLGRDGDPLFFMRDQIALTQGYTTRKNTEPCLLFRSGKPKRQSRKVQELILSPLRDHSRKPDETLDRIEQFCAGPYAEIFSRSNRPGWAAFGDEAGKFDKPSEAA